MLTTYPFVGLVTLSGGIRMRGFMRIVRFLWKDFEPCFKLLNPDRNEEILLPVLNHGINFKLGEKYCVGYFKNGSLRPCPRRAKIERGSQCELCKKLDEYLPCVKCDGSYCLLPSRRAVCKEEVYHVYLATFGNILKVGISRDKRLKQRLVEQGCDFGAKIATIKDGRIARRVEQKIRGILDIKDRVRGAEKTANFLSSPETGMKLIRDAVAKLKTTVISKYLVPPQFYDLRSYYNIVDVKPKFVELSPGARVRGCVVSAKGNLLVVKSESDYLGVNAKELVGYEVET